MRTFEFKKGIEALLKNNVIERSNSPYSFCVVLAEKSDGTIRICIDFRPLNDVTIKDSYPLPRIEDLITQLHGAKYFRLTWPRGTIKLSSENRTNRKRRSGQNLDFFTEHWK